MAEEGGNKLGFCIALLGLYGKGVMGYLCPQVQTILIMDEIQVLYNPEGLPTCLFGGDRFWDTGNRVLQGSGLHIVAFASYGYRGAAKPGVEPLPFEKIFKFFKQMISIKVLSGHAHVKKSW
ncbi:8115_t:CDS:2 [Paraglomus occultum]|uniref:8115_t:CDS:1 n=1 Tax=Paraglomus occultum TaxID=144539 RepID=A0A9N9B6Q6_9GLOM|nr:8115_t:CDS:2 [Paraglomus occultum]